MSYCVNRKKKQTKTLTNDAEHNTAITVFNQILLCILFILTLNSVMHQ